jgi:hypothetical protein
MAGLAGHVPARFQIEGNNIDTKMVAAGFSLHKITQPKGWGYSLLNGHWSNEERNMA